MASSHGHFEHGLLFLCLHRRLARHTGTPGRFLVHEAVVNNHTELVVFGQLEDLIPESHLLLQADLLGLKFLDFRHNVFLFSVGFISEWPDLMPDHSVAQNTWN